MSRIEFGDCRETMRRWALAGIEARTCVTSPPYFGLRDYGHAEQIGMEETPDAYIATMVEVFRGVRDVLADDGTLWLNIGDSYAGSWGAQSREHAGKHAPNVSAISANQVIAAQRKASGTGSIPKGSGLKPKDLIGIPWMLAFALRADGWYLRQEIIWHKPNPMPESVRDRCTKAHESIFLFAKSERYFIDPEGLQEPAVGGLAGNTKPTKGARAYAEGATEHRTAVGLHGWAERQRAARPSVKRGDFNGKTNAMPGREAFRAVTETRNKRSVWTVATRPYPGSHFAVYPPALIEPCILAGSAPGDIVLDPFMGSGTTAEVAIKHGRQYLGCELNPAYEILQQTRIAKARGEDVLW